MLRVDTEIMQSCVRELQYICARIKMNEDELCAATVHLDHISEGMNRCRARVKEQVLVLRGHSIALSNCAKTLERAAERYDRCERSCIDIGMKAREGGGKESGTVNEIGIDFLLPGWIGPLIDPRLVGPVPKPPRPIMWVYVMLRWYAMRLKRVPEGSSLTPLMPGAGTTWKMKKHFPASVGGREHPNPFFISSRELDDAVVKALSVK